MLTITIKDKEEVFITDYDFNLVGQIVLVKGGKSPELGLESFFADKPYRFWRKKAFENRKRQIAAGEVK